MAIIMLTSMDSHVKNLVIWNAAILLPMEKQNVDCAGKILAYF